MTQERPQAQWDVRFFNKLTQLSVQNDYNPYKVFEWPDHIPDDAWWMSRDLLSVYDTSLMNTVDQPTLKRLSKWECINFFSLNVHGIRELLVEVSRRLYSPEFLTPSEFFHRFIAEENDHMWFFAQFCMRYGSKMYPNRFIIMNSEITDPQVETFLIFARILIFEEIVDYFNVRMAKDAELHPLVREINRLHHDDESRHIAAGRQLVKQLFHNLAPRLDPERLRSLDDYLQRYINAMLDSLYNPAVYRDAGFPEPYKIRKELLEHPSRKDYHYAFIRKAATFLINNNIISVMA